MTIRMTLTAVALGTMTLAGCSTMKEDTMAAPVAPAAPQPAVESAFPAANITAPNLNTSAVAPAGTVGTPNVTVSYDSGAVASPTSPILDDASVITGVTGSDPMLANPVATSPVADPTSPILADTAAPTTMVDKDGMMEPGMEGMMKDDASMNSGNAAFDACFASGGQVVNFIGDLSGETMACENDGVQTIL